MEMLRPEQEENGENKTTRADMLRAKDFFCFQNRE
jgi:hypothetical protein